MMHSWPRLRPLRDEAWRRCGDATTCSLRCSSTLKHSAHSLPSSSSSSPSSSSLTARCAHSSSVAGFSRSSSSSLSSEAAGSTFSPSPSPSSSPSSPSSSPSSPASSPYARLESHIHSYISSSSLQLLHQNLDHARPIICLAGSQSTGKSTLCKRLAMHVGARSLSAGALFRELASKRGMSAAQLSRAAFDDPAVDVELDYRVCQAIASGRSGIDEEDSSSRSPSFSTASLSSMAASSPLPHARHSRVASPPPHSPLFIEGRNSSVMASFVRNRLKKTNVISIFLHCSVREQALRFIEREVSLSAARVADDVLPQNVTALRELTPFLRRIDTSVLAADVLHKLCMSFEENDRRDESDQARYLRLYGAHEVMDYRTPELYDIIVETTRFTPQQTFEAVLQELMRLGGTHGSLHVAACEAESQHEFLVTSARMVATIAR